MFLKQTPQETEPHANELIVLWTMHLFTQAIYKECCLILDVRCSQLDFNVSFWIPCISRVECKGTNVNMVTAMSVETLDCSQHSTPLIPESRSLTMFCKLLLQFLAIINVVLTKNMPTLEHLCYESFGSSLSFPVMLLFLSLRFIR
jgi:hypothetical protein